jgi:hypothetical protein
VSDIPYFRKIFNTPVYRLRTGGDVQAIGVSDTEVYIGGHFGTMPEYKLNRYHLASFLVSDGSPTTWDPRADGEFGVWTITVTPSSVVVGGDFEKIGGEFQRGIARFPGTP